MFEMPNCATEFYTIERTVELVINSDFYRVEILCDEHRQGKPFSTRIYKRETISAQPSYPRSSADAGRFGRKLEDMHLWVSIDFPWTSRPTAEGALKQCFGFFEERFANKTP